MRSIFACALVLCTFPAGAMAGVRIVAAGPAGPVVEGQPVDIVVDTDAPVDGARLTYPDLQGVFGETSCSLASGPGATRFVLPYRPGWAGVHMLGVAVTTGACGLGREAAWRLVRVETAPVEMALPAVTSGCPDASGAPIPRTMRAARLAVVCLLNAERAAAGVAPLRASERLRRLASRSAHRPRARGRRGEQRTVTPGTSPEGVVGAWLGSAAHRSDLLAPAVRRVGVAVVARFPEPMRLLETTYVVELD